MIFIAEVDIDEDGIIAQMQRVINAQIPYEREMNTLRAMLWKGKIKEEGSFREPPKSLPTSKEN